MFFSKYNPFKYIIGPHQIPINIPLGSNVEIMLFKNEIEYYSNFFEKYEILEGFYSKKTITHPLLEIGKKIYSTKNKKKEEKNYIKFSLITMHSATNKKVYKTKKFTNIENLINFISIYYMIKKPTTEDELKIFLTSELFNIKRSNSIYILRYIDLNINLL